MFPRLRWLMGLNHRNLSQKMLVNVDQQQLDPERPNQNLPVLDAVHEVAVYIHRFHNLDLFEQGWYKIKVTMRWEEGEDSHPGIPARVVQYEVPEVGSGNLCRIWMIDDTDNSFSTPPFQIKYARQDVFLSIMISFYLSFGECEGQPSAVILKFELMRSRAPMTEIGPELQGSLDAYAASVHEYKIPPKALLGLHSYCPVHFDAFHAVLVDTSVHVSLLKASYHTSRQKVPSGSKDSEGSHVKDYARSDKVMLIKSLMTAYDILLEDLRRISNGINQDIDLTEITFGSDYTCFNSTPPVHVKSNADKPLLQVSSEKAAHVNHLMKESSQPLDDNLLNYFQSLGNQLLHLWNIFLKFHRENKTKILEFLRDSWANDRRTEWSIWMVYSKVAVPHQYMSNGVDGISLHGSPLNTKKITSDPIQTAAMRAELHRRGIAQMRINNQSLQDMCIFEDPLRVPIIILECLTNVYRSPSVGSNLVTLEDEARCIQENGLGTRNKLLGNGPQKNENVLRVAVFVHGFQGSHLDLRLVRNQWLLIDPKIQCLMSDANENKTSEDFREMGFRLAQEVIAFLKKKMDKASRSGNLTDIKLSFVGHSIGNLIIRTALAEGIMEPYLRFLHTYVSVSGPHLGYMYCSNSLFNSGLWLLKKFKGLQCIHQLTFTDDPDLENTFIYNLSKEKTLVHFRNVILLSSPQDGYVPYHSARIELCPAASLDFSKRGKVFMEMLNNCLDQIGTDSNDRVIMRCDVNFDTSSYGRNLNRLVGRTAHIEFLESDIFAKFIMWSFPELFR
ncbi:PREDICTED: protein FAM135B-like isoform X2 [Lupinus angustifolius]|uniref:protein FAM135B-like isoform X2 n=1 Tax=Lupinus angustifolius TaxID=3871 RepID=UPI00092E9727|nr:PREDICTED: protein FAM135B-like isoform X2 [Lupinus angustifolius]